MPGLLKPIRIALMAMCFPFGLYAQEDSIRLNEIEVYGKKKEVAPSQSTSVLSGSELDRTRGQSLGEALQKLPGVTSIQTGPTIVKPVIQGMYGQRVLIMNNGVRQESQQWGSEHAPEVDPFIASELTVVKGASAVRYGSDAIGGVILVEARPLRKAPGLGGEVNLGGFSNNRMGVASGILEYGVKKIPGLSARVQGTYRRGGNSKSPSYYLKNTGLEEINYSSALGYLRKRVGVEIFYSQFTTKVGILSAAHIGNLTDLEKAIASPVPLETSGFTYAIGRPYQQVAHELFKLSAYVKNARGDKWSVVYARQYNDRKEYDKHRPLNDSVAALNLPELELHITTHTANLTFEHSIGNRVAGSIGVSGIYQGNIFKGRYFIPNFKSYAGGIYLQEQWSKNKWLVEAGMRYDYKWMQVYYYKNNVYTNPEFVFGNYSGAFGASYQVKEYLQCKVNVGSAFRAPHVSELFSNGLHHGAAAVEVGDESLKSERAYSGSFTVNLKKNFLVGELTVYQTYFDNYIYLSPVFPATLTIRGAFPTFQYKQISASFTGVDVQVMDTLNYHFFVFLKGSVVKAINLSTNENLVLTPSARAEYGLVYSFSMGKKNRSPYVGLSNSLVAKKRNLPDSSDYAAAPNGYALLNGQAGIQFHTKQNTFDLNLSVSNILNTRYRDYLDRFRYYADGLGTNVSIRLKIMF